MKWSLLEGWGRKGVWAYGTAPAKAWRYEGAQDVLGGAQVMAGLWEDEGKQREWRIWDELDWRGRARSSQVGLYSVDILEPQRWTACLCAPSSVLGAQHTLLDKKDKERCKFHSGSLSRRVIWSC